MRAILVVLTLIATVFACTFSAQATTLSFKITNKSSQAVTGLTITLRGTALDSAPNLLAAPLDIASSSVLHFDPGDTNCVFDLTFTSASGNCVG